MDQIAAPVAVEIDREFQIGRRHELRLAEFAGPGAAHGGGREIAARDEAQSVEQLGLEHVGAATIIGETRERRESSGNCR